MNSVATFAARIETSGSLLACWRMRTRRKDGYATYGNRSQFSELYAHRIVYVVVWGPIPDGFEVDHICRVRNCVNPFHLRAVPLPQNRPGGHKPVSYCPKGHSYKGQNLYVNPKTGKRSCRSCMREANRKARR